MSVKLIVYLFNDPFFGLLSEQPGLEIHFSSLLVVDLDAKLKAAAAAAVFNGEKNTLREMPFLEILQCMAILYQN